MSVVESPRQPRPPRARQLDRRSALLAALRAADRPMSVEEVAASAGIAASTAQFHLSILVSAGDVTRAPSRRGAAGRPSWQYTASTGPGPANAYEDLARVLAAQLDAGAGAAAAARDAGRRWADVVPPEALRPARTAGDARTRLREVLDGLGFAPDAGGDEREIVLRACPFEAVAREHRAVVCSVHLGLVERTAAAIGGGIAIEGLEPFREDQPLACAVRLAQPS